MKKTACKDGQLPKSEDSAAPLQSKTVKTPKETTWDKWFDEEKGSSDFMLLREQS
ncbi:hypothetical protein AB1J88_19065 [Pseudomonas sp. S8]|uniref:hypothetical protein n=1 Tax=Pseudomonas sp. S8 TaxID=211136 RepID=UPI003D28245E